VLDACAGLGGKALHLAALRPDAAVTALDRDAAKLELLRQEAGRLGCANIQAEPRDILADPPSPAGYDLVLVDAPCTGLGVIRRRPDLKWNKTPADSARLAERQWALLKAAAGAVRPGGRLVYGVCSFSLEEGPGVAEKFLASSPGFQPVPPDAWPEPLRPLVSPEGTLTLWPHRHGMDGFFWAVFDKKR
jgi:16S rRNA (cytosine967-C5)-methyltransferase